MSVVVWDGRSLAADKQCTNHDIRHTTTKLKRRDNGEVMAWTGDESSCLMVVRWYEAGADPKLWPDCQRDKDRWGRLIIADANGCRFYEQEPVFIKVEDDYRAWGSGRDFAMGALAMGASARRAVEIASMFNTGCGLGVDTETLLK